MVVVARHDNTFRNDVSRRGKIYIYVRYAKSVIKTRMEFQNEIIDDSGRIIFRE